MKLSTACGGAKTADTGRTMVSGKGPQCWESAIGDRDQRAHMRSSLRADLEHMTAAFEAVALRTRSTAPVPAVRDAATVDELLATWKEMFRGVCAMVLQCQHDLTDDWSPAKIGTELANSRDSSCASASGQHPRLLDPGTRRAPLARAFHPVLLVQLTGVLVPLPASTPQDGNASHVLSRNPDPPDYVLGLVDSPVKHDPVPRSLFGIELAAHKSGAKVDLHLVEAAERRVALVEDQVVNLKELFQAQWGISRQLKQDLATIQSDLDAAKRDANTENFENTELLSQITSEVCRERDSLRQQLEQQSLKLEQTLMDMLQLEKDLDAAHKAKAGLSAQRDELTRLRSEQRADSTQELATLQQQLVTARNERDRLKKLLLQMQSPRKSKESDDSEKPRGSFDAKIRRASQVGGFGQEQSVHGDASVAKKAVPSRENLRQLVSDLVLDCQICYASVQDEYHSISKRFESYESKLGQAKVVHREGEALLPSQRKGDSTAYALENPTERSLLDTAELQVQQAWHAVVQKDGALRYLQNHTDGLEALVQELSEKLETTTLDRDNLRTEFTTSQQQAQQLFDNLNLEHTHSKSALTEEMNEKIRHLQSLNTTLESECGSMRKRLAKADADCHRAQCATEDQRIRARTLEIRVEKVNHRCTELLQELGAAEQALSILLEGLRHQSSVENNDSSRTGKVRRKREEAQSMSIEGVKELKDAEQDEGDERQKVDRLQRQIQELRAQIVEKEECIKIADERETTLSAERDEILDSWNQQVGRIAGRALDIEATHADLVAKWSQSQDEINSLNAKVCEQEQTILDQKEELSNLSTSWSSAEGLLLALSSSVDSVQGLHESLQTCITIKVDSRKIQEPSVTRWLRIALVLDMPLEQIQKKQSAFMDFVADDVAQAVKGDRSKVNVLSLARGSVIVHIELQDGFCWKRDTMDVAKELRRQASDPSSALRQGVFTCKAKNVKISGRRIGYQCRGCGDVMSQTEYVCGSCWRSFTSEAEAEAHQNGCDAAEVHLQEQKAQKAFCEAADTISLTMDKIDANLGNLCDFLCQFVSTKFKQLEKLETVMQDSATVVGEVEQELVQVSKQMASLALHAGQHDGRAQMLEEEAKVLRTGMTQLQQEVQTIQARYVALASALPDAAQQRGKKQTLEEEAKKQILEEEAKILRTATAQLQQEVQTIKAMYTTLASALPEASGDSQDAGGNGFWGGSILQETQTSSNARVQDAVAHAIAVLTHLNQLRSECDSIATSLQTEMMENSTKVIAEISDQELEKEEKQQKKLKAGDGRMFMEDSSMDALSVSDLRGFDTKSDAVEWSVHSAAAQPDSAAIRPSEHAGPPGNQERQRIVELERQVREARSAESKLKAELLETQARCQKLQQLVLQNGTGGGDSSLKLQQLTEDLMCAINDLNNERVARMSAREECDRTRRECRLLEKAVVEVRAQLKRFVVDSSRELELIQSSFPYFHVAMTESTGHFSLRQVRFEVGASEISDTSAAVHVAADHGAFDEDVIKMIADLRRLHGSIYTAILDYQGRHGDLNSRVEAAHEREHQARLELKSAENRCTALGTQVRVLREELTDAREDNEEMNAKLLAAAEKERGLQRDVYELGVSLEKEMKLRHNLMQQLQENASDAADASIGSALELDKREHELLTAIAERDAARSALSRQAIETDAHIKALDDTVQRLQLDLSSLREREKDAADLCARESATRVELETRLQQTRSALELMEDSIKNNHNMRDYLAEELKKEKQNTLKLLQDQHSLQSKLEVRARESAYRQTTMDDLSAENAAYAERVSDLETQLIQARGVKIGELEVRIRSVREGLSPAAAKGVRALRSGSASGVEEHLKEENPRSREHVLVGAGTPHSGGLPPSSKERAQERERGTKGRERGRLASSVFARERYPSSSSSQSFSPPRQRDEAASAQASQGSTTPGKLSATVRGTVAFEMAGRRGRTIFEA